MFCVSFNVAFYVLMFLITWTLDIGCCLEFNSFGKYESPLNNIYRDTLYTLDSVIVW